MDKIVFFAHYDANNTIKDYVVYYLKELSKIAQKIIFVSDCDLPQEELQKIEGVVYYSIAHKHGEYDFGSYKRGYQYAKYNNLLENCEEIIFANDSCYGPLYPLHDVWGQCDSDCDFWGINANSRNVDYHIQSFFIVLKRKVFNSEIFDNFINNIKKEKCKNDIIKKYEIGLSQLLIRNGFVCCSLLDRSIVMNVVNSEFLFSENVNPFIKVSMFKKHTLFFAKMVINFVFGKHKIIYPEYNILNNLDKSFSFSKLLNDLKCFRKCIIKIHLKEKELYWFGKEILGKKKKYKDSEFSGLRILNF